MPCQRDISNGAITSSVRHSVKGCQAQECAINATQSMLGIHCKHPDVKSRSIETDADQTDDILIDAGHLDVF